MNLYRVYIFDENDMHPGPVDFVGEHAEERSILHALKFLSEPHVMVCNGLDFSIFESRNGQIEWPQNLAAVQRAGKLQQAVQAIASALEAL